MGRVSHVLLVEKSFSLEVKIIRVLVVMIIMHPHQDDHDHDREDECSPRGHPPAWTLPLPRGKVWQGGTTCILFWKIVKIWKCNPVIWISFLNILFFEMSALRSSQARTNRHPTIQSRKTISIKQWYKLSLMMFVICCFSGTAAPPQRWEGQHYADVEFKSNNALWRGLQTMATSSQMVFEQPFNVG